jgi:hypothetical protein
MNREFVEKWVAELRSGKYKQNRDGQFAYPQYWIGEPRATVASVSRITS